jgi:hypothetical protein
MASVYRCHRYGIINTLLVVTSILDQVVQVVHIISTTRSSWWTVSMQGSYFMPVGVFLKIRGETGQGDLVEGYILLILR